MAFSLNALAETKKPQKYDIHSLEHYRTPYIYQACPCDRYELWKYRSKSMSLEVTALALLAQVPG